MDVEIVDNEMPLAGGWIIGHRALDMGGEVLFRPRWATGRVQDSSCGDLEVDDETLRAMALILELLMLDLPPGHRQSGALALQGLHPAQFISGQDSLPLLGQNWRLAVQGVDILHFLVEAFIGHGIQPIAHQMRFEIAVFLKASPHDEGRWSRQCYVS